MDEQHGRTMEGTVERVVFRNDQNGWTVLDVSAAGGLHKVVGVMPDVQTGESVKLQGEWVDHPQFGVQFRADSYEHSLPQDADGVLRYLSSGAIKGVGVATAAAIVKKFGDDTIRILEQEPMRLKEIRGITAARAAAIGKEFAAQFGLREVILAFSGYGLTANEAMRCWKKWGRMTVDTIRENPYNLCEHSLYIGFERANEIAARMDILPEDPRRVEAGVLYVLRHNSGNGHTCLPFQKLVTVTAGLLGVEAEGVQDAAERLVSRATLKEEIIDEVRFLFLPHYHRAERYIAARMRLMSAFPQETDADVESRIDRLEKKYRIQYEAKQRVAIRHAISRGSLILTGGPGTGKTTVLKAIITLLEQMGHTVAVAAPTGRAAKRIGELTGREAKTLHRLLEVQWTDEDEPVFSRNEKDPLDVDALVIDELSMVDVPLFESTLRALKSGCRLVLVGDCDQLPAVGAGCVLQDLIAGDVLPVVQLTEVFRQALESRIVQNAHRIVKGQMPALGERDGDFFFLSRLSATDTVETVLDLCARRLPMKYNYTIWENIQILCPGRKGALGTRELNAHLQALLNPPADDKREIVIEGITLREGDKVMQVKNNYDIPWTRDDGEMATGVFNGDIGRLIRVDMEEGTLTVRYDDREALYNRKDAADLEPAYAVTVHKSQGSEFDAVVMPVFSGVPQLTYRNLLYTAVTRAKSLLILVGSAETVHRMVENDRKTLRYTGLRHFLSKTEVSTPWA
ncbi:MAG: ATP-dependent RecD-like DNA helicase [Ruminococcaceae bacterium]|nr:ATP-dependent RecD-like DNA helicase [Oscillospiraceae bacterium]